MIFKVFGVLNRFYDLILSKKTLEVFKQKPFSVRNKSFRGLISVCTLLSIRFLQNVMIVS